jgi:RNA polymerase sigma-70 factor (ECF subfamily)
VTAQEPGSDRAFEALFAEHYVPLARTLRRLLGDAAQAEEVAADAFSRLYCKSPTLTAIENPRAWVYRTGTNLAFDTLRANARRERREGAAELDLRPDDATGDALNAVLVDERRRRVRAILATLKPVHARALLLASDGLSCREVAVMLAVKPDSIYTLIARAKVQFERAYVTAYGRAPL